MERDIKNLQNETLALTKRIIELENHLLTKVPNPLEVTKWINELEIKMNAKILDARRDLSKEINVNIGNLQRDINNIGKETVGDIKKGWFYKMFNKDK